MSILVSFSEMSYSILKKAKVKWDGKESLPTANAGVVIITQILYVTDWWIITTQNVFKYNKNCINWGKEIACLFICENRHQVKLIRKQYSK